MDREPIPLLVWHYSLHHGLQIRISITRDRAYVIAFIFRWRILRIGVRGLRFKYDRTLASSIALHPEAEHAWYELDATICLRELICLILHRMRSRIIQNRAPAECGTCDAHVHAIIQVLDASRS